MNLYLRLLLVWLRNLTGAKRHYLHTSESRFRVLPHDLDAFGHMNNGRYLQIMDVARTEWMIQTGVAGTIRRHRWSPILGGGVICFRHSLTLMQQYRVRTRLLGWDHRWFYLEHCFADRYDGCAAVGVSRAGLRCAGRWVNAHEVADLVHPGARSPRLPGHVHAWIGVEEDMFRHGQDREPIQSGPDSYRTVA